MCRGSPLPPVHSAALRSRPRVSGVPWKRPRLDRAVKYYAGGHDEQPGAGRMSVVELGERAKAASRLLATASTSAKNAALLTAADLLLERATEIQAANDADLEAAEASGMA